jgi:hypothetical protein
MAKKKEVNWTALEIDYRAGVKSLRILASEYGISTARIGQVAEDRGWTRDISAKIKAQAQARLDRAALDSGLDTEKKITEKQVIDANAQIQTDIILSHRTDVTRTRKLTMILLEEAEIATGNNELLRDLANLMYLPDKNGVDKLNEAYQKVISMPGRVDAVKKLAETLKTLIALERQAFGMDDTDRGAGGPEEFLKRLAASGHVDLS